MTEVTGLLNRIGDGDPTAAEKLLPLVYEELRNLARAKMAFEKPGQTLDATGLVHEAYLRLIRDQQQSNWSGRGHFFGAAATAMRRILVETARRKKSLRHGGPLQRVDAELDQLPAPYDATEVLSIDEELDRLKAENPAVARLVELKYFAGFTLEDVARQSGISTRTAHRHWAYAKAWLREALSQSQSGRAPDQKPE